MKKLVIILTMFSVIFAGNLLFAQSDTLVVPALQEDGITPVDNPLIQHIVADTNALGEQNHDVYKLQRGMVYICTQSANFHNPIVLVADKPGNTPETKPPIVMSGIDEAGGVTKQLIKIWNDITIKNIYFQGIATDGLSRVGGNLLVVKADSVTCRLDGVYWDFMGWSSIQCPTNGTSWFIENCHIRNNTRPTGVYCPWIIQFAQHNVDTFIVRNNTVINSNSFFFKGRWMYFNYFEFDHNTIVNEAKWPLHYHWYRDAKITNNIFYNVNAWGETDAERPGQDPDLQLFGIVNVDTLPGNEVAGADTIPGTIPEADRVCIVKNNCYYWSSTVTDYWNSIDSVEAEPWMNERTTAMFADNVNYPGFVEENTYNQDPGFTTVGGEQAMVDWILNERAAGEAYLWYWDPDSADYPDFHLANVQWPLPENLSYSADMTSTDGFHIGDLNWYPDELAQYNPSTAIENENSASMPADFVLRQNYPNPFNPTTTIEYTLKKAGTVKLAVYNMLGQKVKTLVDKNHTAGNYNVRWNATDDNNQILSSGIYFYKLKTGSFTKVKKMVLMK